MEFLDRQIRIFISSTFKDMQEERDALLKVIHEFQNAAAARDVTVVPVDLRWVSTTMMHEGEKYYKCV